MRRTAQSGFTLVEAAIAVAIVSIAAGALFYAFAAFGRYGAHQAGPNREAASALAEQTLRLAQDAWKYGSPGDAPAGTWRTRAPLDATVTAALANVSTSGAQLTVRVAYTPDPGHNDSGSVSITGELAVKAPAPGTHSARPGLIAMPAGAP